MTKRRRCTCTMRPIRTRDVWKVLAGYELEHFGLETSCSTFQAGLRSWSKACSQAMGSISCCSVLSCLSWWQIPHRSWDTCSLCPCNASWPCVHSNANFCQILMGSVNRRRADRCALFDCACLELPQKRIWSHTLHIWMRPLPGPPHVHTSFGVSSGLHRIQPHTDILGRRIAWSRHGPFRSDSLDQTCLWMLFRRYHTWQISWLVALLRPGPCRDGPTSGVFPNPDVGCTPFHISPRCKGSAGPRVPALRDRSD